MREIDEKRIAEIRERCEAANEWLERQEQYEVSAEALKRALADIPWLLEQLAAKDEELTYLHNSIDLALEGEAERLKEIERYKAWFDTKNEMIVTLANEGHKANAEIERLREAQRWIGGQNELQKLL